MQSVMDKKKFRVYGYRWVVLGAFMLINITIQILWIAYAPITGPAAHYYGVSDLQIGFLAMIFMIVYLPLSMPASWLIDTYGFRVAVSIGAVLMSIFGLLRGFAGANYNLVMLSTIGIALAQPFLLNAWTKVAARWFAESQRATAVGLVTIASLFGIAIGMALTPVLILSLSISQVQLLYGFITVVTALLFFVFARESPPTQPCPEGMQVRALMLDGLKSALRVRQFWLFLMVSVIAMGIFNGLTTWIESIVRPRGFSPMDAGTLGALFLVGGAVGAYILPALSDRFHKRKLFLLISMLGGLPGIVGLAYGTSMVVLSIAVFFIGFFIVSAGPVGMQYAAEITYPTPEGTSNGLIQLFGQASVVFVYIMEAMKTPDGSFTPALLVSLGLLVISTLIITRLRDKEAIPAKT